MFMRYIGAQIIHQHVWLMYTHGPQHVARFKTNVFFFFLNLQFRAKRSFLGLKAGERRFSTETLAKAAIYLNKKYLAFLGHT